MERWSRIFKEIEDYVGMHSAPTKDNSPMHDLSETYPDDIYSREALRLYGQGEPGDSMAISIIQSARNKPKLKVKVYRAIPKNLKSSINNGDWVSITKQYATDHGTSHLGGKGNFQIISKTVYASQLYTDGNSIQEWGYNI